ncbi:helix-turn-helix domain-containing protein [Saccharomonospora piscinae]|uniref:helix-turn-helix domain-containing protein n=1 Tax=Saccharomonospora piscinae TaxID=687388 RepID=UPI003CCA35D4
MPMPIYETTSRTGAAGVSRDGHPAHLDVSRSGVLRHSTPEQSEEPIWDLVRRVRRLRGLTQYQLADRLAELSNNSSVSRDEVARWERGKRVPGPYWRQWLSVALGVPVDQLLEAVRCGRLRRAAGRG